MTHPDEKSLLKQFSELFVQTLIPPAFKLNRRHAERVWEDFLPKLFSVGFTIVSEKVSYLIKKYDSAAVTFKKLIWQIFSRQLKTNLVTITWDSGKRNW